MRVQQIRVTIRSSWSYDESNRYGLQFSSAFTYSQAYDDATDVTDLVGAYALPEDSQTRSEWGRSNFDVPLRFVSSFVWDVMPHQRIALLRSWQVAGTSVVQSGQPFTVNSTFDINGDGNLTDRLNTTSGIAGGSDSVSALQLAEGVSTRSLLAPSGVSGAIARNTFRARGTTNLDVALSKSIELGDSSRIVLRCESFRWSLAVSADSHNADEPVLGIENLISG